MSDLKSGLNEASKRIGEANADFKAASSSMEDWTKSTEGLQAKVTQLGAVLNAQKSKLAGLKAEYEKVAREQGENSLAARNLYIRMQNQQAVVNQTEREFNNYSETLKQAEAGTIDLTEVTLKNGKAIEQAGNQAEESGGKFEGLAGVGKAVAGGLLAVGAAAAGAIGSFLSLAESTRETRENFNKLETGFTTAGHSAEDATKTYRALYGLLGDEGQATEAAAHLAQLTDNQEDLAKWTDIATGVYATFGDSLPIEGLTEAANETAKTGALTGSLADALNWAGVNEEQFQASLDACSTEQERQALITSTLNGLYSEQSEKYKELNADIIAAREADAELAQATAELGAIAEPIMTTLKMLSVDLLKTITPFVALIGTGLKGAIEGTAGATDTLAEGIGGILKALVDRFMNLIPTILTVILQLIPSIAETLLGALPMLLNVVVDLVLNIINLLTTLLPDIVTKIVEIIPVLINQLLKAIPQLLTAATTLLMAIVDALPTIISALVGALPGLIKTIIGVLITSIPLLLDAAIQLLNAIVKAIPTIIDALTKNLPFIIETIIEGVLNALPLLLDAAITLFMALVDAIPVIVAALYKALPQIISALLNALKKGIPQYFSAAKQLFGMLLDAIGDLVKKLPSNMGKVITAIVSGLKGGISKVKNIGSDIVKGLWNGIKDMTGWITGKLEGFGDSVLSGIKNFFGIKSPSKLIEEEVGVNVGKAFVPTRPGALSKVKKQLTKFNEFVSDNLGDIKAGLTIRDIPEGTPTVGGNRSGYSVVDARMTVNYNGKLSRKELKRAENDHYTSVKMKLVTEGAV